MMQLTEAREPGPNEGSRLQTQRDGQVRSRFSLSFEQGFNGSR